MFLRREISMLINLTTRGCSSAVAWTPHLKKEERKFEKYGGKYNMTLCLGAGKSREQMNALQDLLFCMGAPLAWEVISEDVNNEKEFKNMITSIRRNGVAVKGNLDDSINPEMSKDMALRRVLDLHSFISECKSFDGLAKIMKGHKKVDVVLIRQNTEGDYMMLEHSPTKKVVEHLRVITLNNSERVAETAFKYADKKKRKRVQCLHRRMVLPLSEQVFIDGFLMAAARYPHIKHEILEMGGAIRSFFKDPTALDVVVANGLEGNLLKSIIYGTLGSSSLVAGTNVGDQAVVFEPSTKFRDVQVQNPISYFLSGALLFEHLKLTEYSSAIRKSLEEVLLDGVIPDGLGGKADLFNFTKAVIKKLQPKMPLAHCSYNQPPPLPKIDRKKPIAPYKPAKI